jgi:predicted ATPase/DNA-binding SARP family transcriptional activator
MSSVARAPLVTPAVAKGGVLSLRLFGEFRALVNSQEISTAAWKRESARKLIAYLALNLGSKVKRDRIAALLGTESDERKLSNALYSLRNAIGPAAYLIGSSAEYIWLEKSDAVWIDVEEFEQTLDIVSVTESAAEKIALLQHASSLYIGPLLNQFEDPHVASDREALRARHSDCLENGAELLLRNGQLDEAITMMERRFDLDRTSDVATRLLIQTLTTVGRRKTALEIFNQHRSTLASAVGSPPSKGVLELVRSLRDPPNVNIYGVSDTMSSADQIQPQADFAAQKTRLERQSARSPIQHDTRLISTHKEILGRESHVSEVLSLLNREQVRLVTLYGLGGVGKTTLAEAVVTLWNAQSHHTASACRVIDARTASRLEDFSAVVSRALEVESSLSEFSSGVPTSNTLRYSLLVLDNFELVHSQRNVLSAVLARFLQLRVLVTSRTPLGLPEEWAYLVRPLPTFSSRSPVYSALTLTPIEIASQSQIVQVFLRRALRSDPAFKLTAENAEAILTIVDALGGIPLAVELAAARCRYMTPQSISRSLAEDLSLMSGSAQSGALQGENASMLGVLEWTYGTLGANAQLLLQFLSIFVGGFTPAEVIAAARPHIPEIYDAIDDLLDSDLIAFVAHEENDRRGDRRCGILEPVRRFAFSKLSQNVEALYTAQLLHATHCNNLLRTFSEIVDAQPDYVKRGYQIEEPNIEAALGFLSSNDEPVFMTAVTRLARIAGAVLCQPVMANYFDAAAKLVTPSTRPEQAIYLLSACLFSYSFVRSEPTRSNEVEIARDRFAAYVVEQFWLLTPEQQTDTNIVNCVFRAFQYQYIRDRCDNRFASEAEFFLRRLPPIASRSLPAQRLTMLVERWRFNTTLSVFETPTPVAPESSIHWVVRSRLELRVELALARGASVKKLLETLTDHCAHGTAPHHRVPVLLSILHYALEAKAGDLVRRLTSELRTLSNVDRDASFHRFNMRLLRTVASYAPIRTTGVLSTIPAALFADWSYYLPLSHDICVLWLRYVAPTSPAPTRKLLLRLIGEHTINDIPVSHSARLTEAFAHLALSMEELDVAQRFWDLSLRIRRAWDLGVTPLEQEFRDTHNTSTRFKGTIKSAGTDSGRLLKRECFGIALSLRCAPLVERLAALSALRSS